MKEVISLARAHVWKRRTKDLLRRAGVVVLRPFWNLLPNWVHHPDPLQLGIALTRICNADCTFCAYQFLEKNERVNMPDDVFHRIIRQMKGMRVDSVHLSPNLGDPLVAPHLLEKIEAIRAAGVRKVILTTNAILLDKIGIDDFLERGPDVIEISTSAFDEEMYHRLYRSTQYKRVRSNILTLLRKNHERPSRKRRYVNVRIRADVPMEQFLQQPEFEEVRRLSDELEWNSAYADWGGLIKPEMMTGSMTFEAGIPHTRRPCQQLFNLAIHPEGEILACACRNVHHDELMSLGHIQLIDLGTAWKRLDHVTSEWKKGRMPQTCATCTMYDDPVLGWPAAVRNVTTHIVTAAVRGNRADHEPELLQISPATVQTSPAPADADAERAEASPASPGAKIQDSVRA